MLLKKGSKGEDVKTVQEFLEITADGIFGSGTERSVKDWQSENGLSADGIVGPNTWSKMGLESSIDTDLSGRWNPNNDTDEKVEMLGKYVSSSGLELDKAYLDSDEYVRDYGKVKPVNFFIHHTAGWDSPYSTVSSWNRDSRGRVATQYVIGGINIESGDSTHDGVVVECFPDGYLGWHTGKTGNFEKVTKSPGVEVCNFGYVKEKNGKFYNYVNVEVPSNQVVDLGYEFRGYQYWHAYTDKQLDSLEKLFRHVSEVYPTINLSQGLPDLLKSGVHPKDAFEFNEDAFKGRICGTWSHTNIRRDKWDMFPQPELIDMLVGL
tara:strand:+ start:17180 stop:18142 length:963 start_codon:yes stop_codon:yes gene_type:complete